MSRARAGVTALGAYAPAKIVSNADLEKIMDTNDEWITSRTGIKNRHVSADDEYTSTLAFRAVEDLLARHGERALDGVDLVVVATNTPDAFFPATAALVQERFKLTAGVFDVLTACSGWLYALATAKAYVESGMRRRVLTIGAETLTKFLDWSDRSTAILFGDGAGAAIVERVPEPYGLKSFVLGADGAGAKHLNVGAVAPYLPDGTPISPKVYQNGPEVFKFAVRIMQTASLEAIQAADMTPKDISLFVPHQANLRIIKAARERLELPEDRVVVTIQEYGNNSTASIPLALKHALDDGRIHDGDNLLLVAFGGGLSWGATVLTWGGGS